MVLPLLFSGSLQVLWLFDTLKFDVESTHTKSGGLAASGVITYRVATQCTCFLRHFLINNIQTSARHSLAPRPLPQPPFELHVVKGALFASRPTERGASAGSRSAACYVSVGLPT